MKIVQPWVARLRGLIWPWRWCFWLGRCQPIVVLVRHADVTPVPGIPDPPLNAEGLARADDLRRTLADLGVDAIFVTGFQRTQQTAEPLATTLGITPAVIDDASGIVTAIRELPASAVALVVGHSNTIPDIIDGLGGPVVTIGAMEFDRLFIWTRRRLLPLRYGS